MNNRINGYSAGHIQAYRQMEKGADAAASKPASASGSPETSASEKPVLHPDLSEAESGMIRRYFPQSENLALRLYGPGEKAKSINPNAVGRRLDMRG